MMGNKKLQVWLPLLFSIILILGMFLGYRLNTTGNGKGFFKPNRSTALQQALDLVRTKYVDNVNTDSLQSGAIQELMTALDPHSVYFPPVELKKANEELAGNFDGIGVEFNIFSDTVNIVYVVPGGPSEQAGLQIGDKLISVNDSSLLLRDIPSSKIREFIRGEKGSIASIKLLRDGKILKVNVSRGSIPVSSVDAAYMIDARTGYIKLNKFTQNSYEEFMAALEMLQKKGMSQLIYDLRGNGGGFMNEAFDMADEFLDQDKLVVYTEGVNSKKEEFRCKRPGLFEKGKLIVLMDELSASASEVLAGALQDWDRATIIGRRSFGKGLVQIQFPLSDGSAVRLTTARYYTPLGRSIQRPYDKGKREYMNEINQRFMHGEALYADSNKVHVGKVYITPNGDSLYAGGGIMPNIFVPIDTASYPADVNKLFVNGSFNNFVYLYYLQHKKPLEQYSSAGDYSARFADMEGMWQQFIGFAARESVNLQNLSAKLKQTLQGRLKAYLAHFRWRNDGYYQVLNDDDIVITTAREKLAKP